MAAETHQEILQFSVRTKSFGKSSKAQESSENVFLETKFFIDADKNHKRQTKTSSLSKQ